MSPLVPVGAWVLVTASPKPSMAAPPLTWAFTTPPVLKSCSRLVDEGLPAKVLVVSVVVVVAQVTAFGSAVTAHAATALFGEPNIPVAATPPATAVAASRPRRRFGAT